MLLCILTVPMDRVHRQQTQEDGLDSTVVQHRLEKFCLVESIVKRVMVAVFRYVKCCPSVYLNDSSIFALVENRPSLECEFASAIAVQLSENRASVHVQ